MAGNENKKWIYRICRVVYLLYVAGIIYALFFSERYGRNARYETMQYNLVPFEEIQRYIMNLECFTFELFVANIAGNICMFIPFGALLFVWKEKPVTFLNVTFYSLFLSLSIELIQLVTRVGVFDVDDILMNTVGGMIGYFVYAIARIADRRLQVRARRQKKL